MRLLSLRASLSQTFPSPTQIGETIPRHSSVKLKPNVSLTQQILDSVSETTVKHSIKVKENKEGSNFSSKVCQNWMKYQGSNDWAGLLDPLDVNLGKELLRYGQFVKASYRAFDDDATSPTYASCKFSKSDLLSSSGVSLPGYKVTKNLRATCGVQLHKYGTDRIMPNWMTTQSSWIGFVAVCTDKDEIARLGRRDVVIAFRGTVTCLEWLENFNTTLACLPDDNAMVMAGFLSLYKSSSNNSPSLRDSIREEIGRILELYGDEPLSITITGHSLGAALATLTAHDTNATFANAPMVTVISFGGPRVGNRQFGCQLQNRGVKVLRIVNPNDVITKMPGFAIHDVVFIPGWLQKQYEDAQSAYADAGKELRLSSKDCHTISHGNVATRHHELDTYLELIERLQILHVLSKLPQEKCQK